MKLIQITEYLNVDLEKEMWCCERCGEELISVREPYVKGCLVHDRPAQEIYGSPIEIASGQHVDYAPDPRFNHVLEFYCPHCGTMIEVQYLPPGLPIPEDIVLDIDSMKDRYQKGLL